MVRSEQIAARPHAFPHQADLGPETTALFVIDMQHDFVSEHGYMHRMGCDLTGLQAPIEPIGRILEAARELGYHVVHTREGYAADLSDLQPWKRAAAPREPVPIGDRGSLGRALVRGEPGWQIVDALAPLSGEVVLDKASYGVFATTEVDELLRRWGIRNLILTGVTTDCCVTSCLREALDRGYDCLVVEDCVGASDVRCHEAALALIGKPSGVFGAAADSQAVIRALREAGRDRA